ncbi:MAG: serine/threonine protein kinase [bacterium]|nr:serine/threonine protein kinase [bacterium]
MVAHDDSQWRLVRSTFEECLELDSAARAARLAEVEPGVRTEVVALLDVHQANVDRLQPDQMHQSLVDASRAPVAIGSRIGGYHVVEVIGRGGMGTVFLAEQQQPRRRVAIKLLDAHMTGGETERRFRLEAELLGRLQHSGIARIHEAGVHEEVSRGTIVRWPFFAMEYVEGGVTLDGWRAAASRSEREVLELFLQICIAVQHAHERGVVHRDLKPHNVLVDPAGRPRVIDFGIARVLGADSGPQDRTRTGELLGTLRYMSPEQIRGESITVDTRTDVHALGVMLFELLTGAVPFDLAGKGLPEVGATIVEAEPELLRVRMPDANADLELLLATAMAKDPAQRYGSAGSLAEDLQRYLAREPISARPPSLKYQVTMFARRRRGLVIAIAALLFVSTVGGATSLIYALRAHRAEERAVSEGRDKADAMRRVFDSAIATVLDVPRRLAELPGATRLRAEVIEKAFEQLRFVEQNASLDTPMRLSLARAYLDLAGVQGGDFVGNLGDRSAALASLRAAREHVDQALVAASRDPVALFLLFDIEFQAIAITWNSDRDPVRSQEHWNTARTAVMRLREVVPPADLRLTRSEARLAMQRGHQELAGREFAAAIAHFRAALKIFRAVAKRSGSSLADRATVAEVLRFIGIAAQAAHDPNAAIAAFDECTRVLAEVVEQGGSIGPKRLLAMTRTQLGYLLASRGKSDQGEAEMRAGYLELERLHDRDRANAGLKTSLAQAAQRLGDHLSIQARYDEDPERARELYSEARQLAMRGLDIARRLRETSRDMVNIFVIAECERIQLICDDALRR